MAKTKETEKKNAKVAEPEAKSTKATKAAGKVVTINDLCEEYGLEPRKLRAFLRTNGYKAPEVEREGFGPKSKYEWAEGSKELAAVKKLIDENLENDDESAEG